MEHKPDWEVRLKTFIADVARPFAIISTSAAAATATIIISLKVDSVEAAAIFIGAVFTGVAALYGAKALENSATAKHAASIEIAKSSGPTPPNAPIANITVE
jgi:hypothetical protein